MLVVKDRVIHEVAVHEQGGCCDEHPYAGYTVYCYDCEESFAYGVDFQQADSERDEHIAETAIDISRQHCSNLLFEEFQKEKVHIKQSKP